MWVRKDRQKLIWPTVISLLGQGPTPFQLAFSYEGTADYRFLLSFLLHSPPHTVTHNTLSHARSAYLSFSEGLKFRESLGGDQAIMSYMHNLAVSGGNHLAQRWNTDLLVDPSMIGAMVNVRLPTINSTLAQEISRLLPENYHTWVPVYPLQVSLCVCVCACVCVRVVC